MTHEEFEQEVDDILGRLPDWVHESLNNISIQVLDEPEDVVRALQPDR